MYIFDRAMQIWKDYCLIFVLVEENITSKNFHHYMCLDFLKNSFCDEFFHHYMYPNIVLVTKLFVTKYDLVN